MIQSQSVMDGRTDRGTDAQAMAKTREAFCYRTKSKLRKRHSFFSTSHFSIIYQNKYKFHFQLIDAAKIAQFRDTK